MDDLISSAEQSFEQRPPFYADVDALDAGALGFVSWQFDELRTHYSNHEGRYSEQLLEARDAFHTDMRHLGERNPGKAAAVYEGLSAIDDVTYRKHAVDCIEAYAAVRPSHAFGYVERLVNDENAGIRDSVRAKLEQIFIAKDEAQVIENAYTCGLTSLQAARLIITLSAVERSHARGEAAKLGTVGLRTAVQEPGP